MSIFRHTAVVSGFTGASRLLGFLREVLMAHFFGTTLAKSAFDIAFRIPNLFRRLFGEGALSAAFVPVFSETLSSGGQKEARELAGKVMTLLATVLLMIVIGAIAIIKLALAHGFNSGRIGAVLPLLGIMFPYMFFICLVALCMGILNACHRFALPAATPILLNVVWILALYILCPRFGTTVDERIYGVAWGILIAGALQLLAQIPALLMSGVMPIPSFSWHDPRLRSVLLLMGPAAIGRGVHQLNVVIDGLLALWVGDWAPAALTYAERLIYLPLGIFATAMGTVLLATFSKQTATSNISQIPRTMADSLKGLMLFMLPATAGLMVLTTPIVQLAFEWEGGKFDATSTILTARALWWYAPGLVVFSLYKILVPAFYALKDTKTPVRIGIYAVFANFILNILFILTWPDGYKHAGLACATVIASALNCIALALLLSQRVGSPGWKMLAGSLMRTLLATIIMVAVLIMAQQSLPRYMPVFESTTKLGQLLAVGSSITLGIASYVVAAMVFCRREIQTIRLKSKAAR